MKLQKLLGRPHAAGFTLLEMLVVLMIIALLAGIVVPKLIDKPDQARVTATRQDMLTISQALRLYKMDNGQYPTTDQGLAALVQKPSVPPVPENWKTGGYLERMPKDPWGNAYIYISPGTHGPFDLISYGADGKRGGTGSADDIDNWDTE